MKYVIAGCFGAALFLLGRDLARDILGTESKNTSAMVICQLPGDNGLSYTKAKATRVNGAETDIWFADGTYEEVTSPCEVIYDTKR